MIHSFVVVAFSLIMTLPGFMSVVASLDYDLSCFKEATSNLMDQNRDSLVTIVDMNYSSLNFPKRNDLRQAHYVDGMCGIHIFLYIPSGYVLLQYLRVESFQFNCEWQDPVVQSSLPVINVTSIGRSEIIDEPFREEVPFDLPFWNGMIVHAFFAHLVVEGKITGLCSASFFSAFSGDVIDTPTVSYTIQINGCPRGRYGANCDHDCPCAQDIQCHSFNGVCICPKGFAGDNCETLDPYLEIGVEYLYVKWGTTLTVNCTAYGFTDANLPMTWQRNDTVLGHTTRASVPVAYAPRPVRLVYQINNVTESYNDIYQCIANQTIIREVNITVYDLPDPFVKFPTNQTVVYGSNITLICQVRAHAGTVKWTRDNTAVSDDTVLRDTGNLKIDSDPITGESTLTIMHAYLEDEAVYRCFVGHTFEADDITFAEAYVTIVVPPSGEYPVLERATDGGNLVVKEDGLVSVTCAVYNVKPIPELKWTLGDKEFNDDREKLIELVDSRFEVRSTITFPVYREDNLKYLTCRAESNEFGDAEKSMRLNVTYKPVVQLQPNYIEILEDGNLQVKCLGSSNPIPITYRWECSKPNGDVIRQYGQTFNIPDVSSDFDQSSLRCIASNNIGTSYAILKVNVLGEGVPLYAFLPASALVLLTLLIVVPLVVYRHRRRIQRIANQFVLPEAFKDDKEFDVFISYKGDTDEELFVITKLVPKLEEMGFAVCVHYKHFVGGKTIMQNILHSIAKSRKTIIVLSRAFVESQWCRYEFMTASAEILKSDNNVIPLMFEDVTQMPNLDVMLKDLLERINYISWPRDCNDGDPDDKRFWELLKHALNRKISPVDALI